MRIVKLLIGLLALLGAAYFTFYVPLGDGRTLGSHLAEIARSEEARQLRSAVETSVNKAKKDIVREVDNENARPSNSGAPAAVAQDKATRHPRKDHSHGQADPPLDREALRRLISESGKFN